MSYINRAAIIVKPKQPFLAWTKLDDEAGLADRVFQAHHDDPTVFLVPTWEDSVEQHEIVKEFWPALFDEMLVGWSRDESSWPKKRTFEMFGKWFEVEANTTVQDIYLDEAIEDID